MLIHIAHFNDPFHMAETYGFSAHIVQINPVVLTLNVNTELPLGCVPQQLSEVAEVNPEVSYNFILDHLKSLPYASRQQSEGWSRVFQMQQSSVEIISLHSLKHWDDGRK